MTDATPTPDAGDPSEPLPCPFCGEPTNAEGSTFHDDTCWITLYTRNGERGDHVFAAWNRRAVTRADAPVADVKLLELLEQCRAEHDQNCLTQSPWNRDECSPSCDFMKMEGRRMARIRDIHAALAPPAPTAAGEGGGEALASAKLQAEWMVACEALRVLVEAKDLRDRIDSESGGLPERHHPDHSRYKAMKDRGWAMARAAIAAMSPTDGAAGRRDG